MGEADEDEANGGCDAEAEVDAYAAVCDSVLAEDAGDKPAADVESHRGLDLVDT